MSSIVAKYDLIKHLEYFGLAKTDAKIYLTILKTGPITAREISKILNIHRGLTYQSLGNLKNLSMIQTTFSNPTKCIAINPNDALKNLVARKHEEYIISKKLAQNIIYELNEITKPIKPSKDIILSVIQGKYNVYSKIENILENAQNIAFIISPLQDVMKFYYTSIPEKIKLATKRGIQVNLLTDTPSEKERSILLKMGTKNIKFRKNLEKTRIILEEKMCVLISNDLLRGLQNSDIESGLYTNAPDITNNMTLFCNHLWNRAISIEQLKMKKTNLGEKIAIIQ